MNYKSLLDVPAKWQKTHRSFNAQLIPNKLKELAIRGIYFDDRLV